jgi:hypothetical protein
MLADKQASDFLFRLAVVAWFSLRLLHLHTFDFTLVLFTTTAMSPKAEGGEKGFLGEPVFFSYISDYQEKDKEITESNIGP